MAEASPPPLVNGSSWEPEPEIVQLLEAVLTLARTGHVHSVGLVLVKDGEYRVSAAGPDIHGLNAGAKALSKELRAIVEPSILELKPNEKLN